MCERMCVSDVCSRITHPPPCIARCSIRYAHRIVELDNLPHGLNSMPSIKRVSAWYRQSFDQIRSCPDPVDSMSVRADRPCALARGGGGRAAQGWAVRV